MKVWVWVTRTVSEVTTQRSAPGYGGRDEDECGEYTHTIPWTRLHRELKSTRWPCPSKEESEGHERSRYVRG